MKARRSSSAASRFDASNSHGCKALLTADSTCSSDGSLIQPFFKTSLPSSQTENSPIRPRTSRGSTPVSSLMRAATRAARAPYDFQILQWRITISLIRVTSQTSSFRLQGTSTSLPNCARSSNSSCARRASASGSVCETTARICPRSMNFMASSSSAFDPMNEPSKLTWR